MELENGADLHVNERQKIRHYRARSTEERRIRRRKKNAKSRFFYFAYELLDKLFGSSTVTLRDKTLWRMSYESAARPFELLAFIEVQAHGGEVDWLGFDRAHCDVVALQVWSERLLKTVAQGGYS